MSSIRTYENTHSEQKPLLIKQKDTTDYFLGGSLVVKNGKIDKILFEGGYAQATAVNKTTNDKFAFYYYNQDHLGNNREVVDASGAVTQVTNYYPFGAPYADATASKGAAVQPYKYNGKELDLMHGLNTYDYGARQYDPILARWDRVDPLAEKYYNVSPYVYCGNNPVMLVDPDGKEIFMVGSYKQRMELLGFLQQLSNDELAMKQNGQVFIKKTGNRNSGQNLNLGTELVASVLNHHHIVTIQSTMKNSRTHSVYRGNSTNGKGTDVNIFVNPKKPVNTLVRNNKTGKSVYETTPTYITLGHELVHSLHNINGTAKDHDDKSEYIFMDIDGLMKKTKARTEELETTGIIGNSEISENKLREEHNLNLRIHY
jgi:RHS repeat-associated protein